MEKRCVSYEVRTEFIHTMLFQSPVPVAARSKAQVCGRSPAEIVGSNHTGGHGCLSVVSVGVVR